MGDQEWERLRILAAVAGWMVVPLTERKRMQEEAYLGVKKEKRLSSYMDMLYLRCLWIFQGESSGMLSNA